MSEKQFTQIDSLAALTDVELTAYILQQSEKISEAERNMRGANDILHERGTTIDEQLDKMRHEN